MSRSKSERHANTALSSVELFPPIDFAYYLQTRPKPAHSKFHESETISK
jgi:hypothetical protein